MRRLSLFFLISTIVFLSHQQAKAQKAILVSSTGKFFEFDVLNGNCTTKEITSFCNLNAPGFSVAQYKNKVYFSNSTGVLFETDLTNPALCKPLPASATNNAMTADRNGTLYWVDGSVLYRLPVGWPQAEMLGVMPYSAAGDLVFYDDKLIMAARPSIANPTFSLVEVNISSPANSKIFMQTPGYDFYGLINVSVGCNENKVYGISLSLTGPGSDIIEIDMKTRSIVGKTCYIDVNVFDAASVTETGEVKGININTISVKPQCAGQGLGEIGVAATSATPGATLSFSLNNNAATTSGVFPNLTAGNYSIKVTSSDGCTKDTITTVKFIERIEVSMLTKPDTCGNLKGSVEVNKVSNHIGLRFSLENAAYVAGNVFTNLSAGIKSLKVIETNGCELDTNFTIASFQPPIPVTSLIVTNANCANADGQITLNYLAGATIQGARIDGGVIQTGTSFSNLTAGTHQIQIITPSCTFDTTVIVPLQNTPAPTVSYITNPPDCVGKNNGSVQISLTGTVGPYSYSFNNSTYSNATTYQNLAPGNYPVAVKDAQGCIFSGNVTVQPYVAKPVTIQSSTIPSDCWQADGGKAQITIAGTESPYFFKIDNRSFISGQQVSGLAPGSYMALISNGNNCLVDSVPINIIEQNTPGVVCDTVYVPSGFTPNADGKNDVLRPVASNAVSSFVFRVYNRFGQVLFETNQPQKGWNGRFNGVEQPAGVYVWTFSHTVPGGRLRTFKGTAVLLR